jgi:alpha-D-ribose 1-methylphosphonate 5-triphosphate synthase subunit PhnL
MTEPIIVLENVAKSFVMHLQGGVQLPVINGISFDVSEGECVVLGGPSGIGKSSLLKMIYGNYRCDRGRIVLRDGTESVDIASASARLILQLRARMLSYVSQFLRVIPRVPAIEIIENAAVNAGLARQRAHEEATYLLERLAIPPIIAFCFLTSQPPRLTSKTGLR